MEIENKIKIKPVLRWAGGKTWLTKTIKNYLPENFNNYHEPFLGGGSVALHLANNNILKNKIYLSDFNPKLIEFYQTLIDSPQELIAALQNFKNTKEFYYQERSKTHASSIDRAAQFYFLNRTSFNGIYRENLMGKYNVPYGNKNYDELVNTALFFETSRILKNAKFESKSFLDIKKRIKKKDLVFLDPPYTVAHENNGFVKYNQNIFSWNDQIELRNLIDHITKIQGFFILTNAYHDSILDLYAGVGQQTILERSSVVGGKFAKRTSYKELLITNI